MRPPILLAPSPPAKFIKTLTLNSKPCKRINVLKTIKEKVTGYTPDPTSEEDNRSKELKENPVIPVNRHR